MLNNVIILINFIINIILAIVFFTEMIKTLKYKNITPFVVNLITFIHFVISAIYVLR